MSHVSYVWVMSPIYESCLLCMSHVYIKCRKVYTKCLFYNVSYIWVMSPMYESCLLYMSHVSYVCVMSPIYESCLLCMSHVSCVWVTYYMLHVTYSSSYFWLHIHYILHITHTFHITHYSCILIARTARFWEFPRLTLHPRSRWRVAKMESGLLHQKWWSCILPHIGVCAVQLSTEILVWKYKICQRGTFAAPHSV